MNLGASEIVLVLFVVLLLFGGKRLPELARNLGRGLAEFRRATQSIQQEVSTTIRQVSQAPPPTTKQPVQTDTPPPRVVPSADPSSQSRTPEPKFGRDS